MKQGENFYLIESGNCQVYNEKLGNIKQLTKGDYFGELALIKDLPRQATVEALDNVIVATLGKRVPKIIGSCCGGIEKNRTLQRVKTQLLVIKCTISSCLLSYIVLC